MNKRLLAGLFCIPFLIVSAVIGLRGIDMDRNCLSRLKRAADANTVELAHTELHAAITYLEQHKLTTGFTSIVYNTPDEDIEFFYKNLLASQAELEAAMVPGVTQLEKSNVLIKLRETLIDHSQQGDHVTAPPGLSRAPANGRFAVAFGLTLILFLGGFGLSANKEFFE